VPAASAARSGRAVRSSVLAARRRVRGFGFARSQVLLLPWEAGLSIGQGVEK